MKSFRNAFKSPIIPGSCSGEEHFWWGENEFSDVIWIFRFGKVFAGDKVIPRFSLFSLELQGPSSACLFYFRILSASEVNTRPRPSCLPSNFGSSFFFFPFFFFPFAISADLRNRKRQWNTLFPSVTVWPCLAVSVSVCQGKQLPKTAISNITQRPPKQHCKRWCRGKVWIYHLYHLLLQQSILTTLSERISLFWSPDLNQL